MWLNARMGCNGVRRSGITRALAVIGYGMAGMVLVMVAAYAAVILAVILAVVAVVVTVAHLFQPAPAPLPVPDVHDDAMSRAHRALRTR